MKTSTEIGQKLFLLETAIQNIQATAEEMLDENRMEKYREQMMWKQQKQAQVEILKWVLEI